MTCVGVSQSFVARSDNRPALVGAAEGCDLLILLLRKDQRIAASFHSTAPTGAYRSATQLRR
ncbi:conserved hypothetical protein [Pseudomonas sp. IT-P258]